MIWTLIIGLIVGAIAKLLMPGKDPGGIIVTMLLGVAGAMLAGFVGRAMGLYLPEEPAGIFAAVIGAMLILFAYKMLRTRSAQV